MNPPLRQDGGVAVLLSAQDQTALRIEALPVPVIVTDETGTILYGSDVALTMFGATGLDVSKLNARDFYVNAEDRARLLALILRDGVAHEFEAPMRTHDGRTFWALISARLVPDGARRTLVTVLQDITGRKNAEAEITRLVGELRRREATLETRVSERTRALTDEIAERRATEAKLLAERERFADVVALASDWVWETDPDHRFTYVSDRWKESSGLDPSQLMGRSRADLAGEQIDSPKWAAHLAQLHRREPFRDFIYARRRPDGTLRHVQISGLPKFDPAGRFLGYRGTGRDITTELRAQEAIRETHAILSATVEHMEQGVGVFGPDLGLRIANPRFAAIMDLPAEFLRPGASFMDIIRYRTARGDYGPIDAEDLVKDRERSIASRRPYQHERLMPSGTWLQVNNTPLPGGGVIVSLTDITAIKRSQVDLSAARDESAHARRQLTDAIEAMSEGFVLYDARDRLVMCNSRYREEYSAVPELMVPGTPYADIIRASASRRQIPEGFTEQSWIDHRLASHRQPGPAYLVHRPDGHWVRITEYKTSDGGIVSIRTDVTDLKRRERELKDSRRLLRAVIDAVPAIINVKDLDSRYILMNRFQGEVYGVDPRQAIGRTSADLTGTYGEGSRALDLDVIRSGQPQRFAERDFVDPRGKRRVWFTAKTPLKDERDQVKNVVTVALDITDFKATERARGNLARYFAPTMVERLAAEDEPLGPARSQDVSVMFVDIFDFTRLCMTDPPDRVFALLREFLARIANQVFVHGGTLDKYMGDGTMATFGTPDPGPRDATNALICARDIRRMIDGWNAERGAAGEAAIEIGIGIHHGPALLGNIGNEQRLEFAVVGDTVNVASRLEKLTREIRHAGIVASEALIGAARREGAGDVLAAFQAIGPRDIRGRSEKVPVWILPREQAR